MRFEDIRKKKMCISAYSRVLIIQGISTRNKQTGKYKISQDGNVNLMLSRLSANHITKNVTFVLPDLDRLDQQSFEQFKSSSDLNNPEYIHARFYGINIDETRKNLYYDMRSQGELSIIVNRFVKKYKDEYKTVICEFPFELTEVIDQNTVVYYNYNWNKSNDDVIDTMLDTQFFSEIRLSEKYQTFLLSSVQYEYWINYCKKYKINSHVYLGKDFISIEKLKDVSAHILSSTIFNDDEKELIDFISERSNEIIFYPMRLDDDRYKLNDVLRQAKLF